MCSIIDANLSDVFPFGYMRYHSDWRDDDKHNALLKFVRNAPSTLRWFRSDLTPDNMTTLRLEQPGIELLNCITNVYCTIGTTSQFRIIKYEFYPLLLVSSTEYIHKTIQYATRIPYDYPIV